MTPKIQGLRVLVLDDSSSFRNIHKYHILHNGGVPILTASNEEVEALIKKLKPGETLCDAGMLDWNLDPEAGIGGLYTESTARYLLTHNIPTIILSGTDDETGRLVKLREEFRDGPFKVFDKTVREKEILADFPPHGVEGRY